MQGLTYPVAIQVNMRPGYSDYNLGQQLKKDLESRGATVKMLDKKQPSLFSHVSGHHLVSFYTDMVWPHYKYSRHSRPKSVLSIQCIGPKVYPIHEYVCYLATLAKPKIGGIPVHHMNVSPSTVKEFTQISRTYFSPSMCRQIEQQTSLNYYGIEPGFQPHAAPDRDSLVVPYNRWEPGQKNLPLHMQMSGQYKALMELHGGKVEQVYYINKDDFESKKEEIPAHAKDVYEFRDQFYARQDMYDNIGQHGMFLSTSVRESFGLYFLELMAAGSVGVFDRYPWIESLLPEYRFMGGPEELVPMMKWVRDNYDEARAYLLSEVVPIIRTRFSQQAYLDRIYGQLQRMEAMDSRLAEQEEA